MNELTDDKMREVDEALRAAIEAGLEEGWALRKGEMRANDGTACACAVGMLVRDVPFEVPGPGGGFVDQHSLYMAAAERLGLSMDELTPIWSGFDGVTDPETYLTAYGNDPRRGLRALGARIRQDYYDEEAIHG